jgi:hypothetical protein
VKCARCEFEVVAGQPCANCARFEQFRQTARALGKVRGRPEQDKVTRAGKGGSWWMKKAREHAATAAAGELPLSGQDAALPVGDR